MTKTPSIPCPLGTFVIQSPLCERYLGVRLGWGSQKVMVRGFEVKMSPDTKISCLKARTLIHAMLHAFPTPPAYSSTAIRRISPFLVMYQNRRIASIGIQKQLTNRMHASSKYQLQAVYPETSHARLPTYTITHYTPTTPSSNPTPASSPSPSPPPLDPSPPPR